VGVDKNMSQAIRRGVTLGCVSIFALLLGCDSQVVYKNISQNVPEIIGVRYRVKGQVLVYGVRKHSRAPIDYIQLMPPPGIGGTQIVPLTPIPVGSVFKVLSAWKSSRFTPNTHSVLVEFENYALPEKVPTRIEYFRGNNQYWWGFELNREYYERISENTRK
jgi:hypothetical protein